MLSITVVITDREPRVLSNRHASEPHVPARDHAALPEAEEEAYLSSVRFTLGAVKYCAIFKGTGVVGEHHMARLGLGAVAVLGGAHEHAAVARYIAGHSRSKLATNGHVFSRKCPLLKWFNLSVCHQLYSFPSLSSYILLLSVCLSVSLSLSLSRSLALSLSRSLALSLSRSLALVAT